MCVFAAHGWDIKEFLDINHAMLCFVRSFENINGKEGKCLQGLLIKLKLWTYHCIYMVADIETKLRYYYNAENHYTGVHTYCEHDKDHLDFINPLIDEPETKKVLHKFLEDNEYIIRQCDPISNTQHNESFNNTRASKALKSICWKDSYEARVMAAILDVNCFETDWKQQLRQILNLPELPPACIRFFEARHREKLERRKLRSTSDWLEAERIRRLCQRKKLLDLNKGILEYNVNHIPKFHIAENEITTLVKRMKKDEFRNFIETQFDGTCPELVQLTKAFIQQKSFSQNEYFKKYFNFCKSIFSINQEQFCQAYDAVLMEFYDTLTINPMDASIEMQRINNISIMMTDHARETLSDIEEIPPVPGDVPIFPIKSVKIAEKIEQKLVFPQCKGSSSAIRKLDGLIVSMDEADNYEAATVFPISNSNHAIILRDPLPRSIDYNCEIVLFNNGQNVSAYLVKPEKILFAGTQRERTVRIKAGDLVTVNIAYLMNRLNGH